MSPLARGQDLASYFPPVSVAFRYRVPPLDGVSVPGRLLASAPTFLCVLLLPMFCYQCQVTRAPRWGVGQSIKDSPARAVYRQQSESCTLRGLVICSGEGGIALGLTAGARAHDCPLSRLAAGVGQGFSAAALSGGCSKVLP